MLILANTSLYWVRKILLFAIIAIEGDTRTRKAFLPKNNGGFKVHAMKKRCLIQHITDTLLIY